MKNSIKEIVREYKSKILLDGVKSMRIDSETQKASIINASSPILNIMNKSEKEVIEDYKEQISKLKLYNINTSPVKSGVGYVADRVSIKNDLIKIVTAHSSCGDSWYSTVKIPLSYFDMSDDEIKTAHTKWSHEYFKKEIKNSKIGYINKKTKEIAKLKKEIKELSK